MESKTSTKPTEGNINLMLSIEEIEHILKSMDRVSERTSYLVELDKHTYRLPNPRVKETLESKTFTLTKQGLIRLLTAPLGLYNSVATTKSITTKTKFRIELKLNGGIWEIA